MKHAILTAFVIDQEAQLAPTSETCLWGAYKTDFEGAKPDDDISKETFDKWADAYAKYRELEESGSDFCVSDCF